jgi:N-acetyl-gamma-glutamyl-phosphate reductase
VIRAAVLGASGYTGAEVLRILVGHPAIEVVAVCADRSAGARLSAVFPQFRGRLDLELERVDPAALAARADVAFSCLPHGDSARLVAALVEAGVKVVDLSADFRLRDVAEYAAWYGGGGHEHPAPALLAEAVYGLPERHRAAIRGARLVASAGCFPTAAILALAPLLERGLIGARGIIVDAKSGVSGAGRATSLGSHFSEIGESVRAYKVAGGHRHTPEIEQELGRAAGEGLRLTFTPHLIPMVRGILSCGYATPSDPELPAAAYQAALEEAYRGEPFVDVLGQDALPDTAHVRGSNRAQVAVRLDARAGRVLAISAIDNLVKGAAGQAVQCMNLVLGLSETAGLGGVAMFP